MTAGQDERFVAFVRAESGALLRTATVLTRSPEAAEDLVQETLARLYPKWPLVEAADSPPDYVHRALINQFLSQQRRPRPVPARQHEPSGTDFAGQVAERDRLRRLLDGLSDRQRTALVLRYYRDLGDQQIADLMACRVGTVRSLISRALSTLRDVRMPHEEQSS